MKSATASAPSAHWGLPLSRDAPLDVRLELALRVAPQPLREQCGLVVAERVHRPSELERDHRENVGRDGRDYGAQPASPVRLLSASAATIRSASDRPEALPLTLASSASRELLLGARERAGGLRGDLVGELPGGSCGLGGGDKPRYEPGLAQLCGADPAAREHEVARQRRPELGDEDGDAAPADRDPEVDLGQPEHRVLGHNPQVARRHEHHPSPDHAAVSGARS